jgi:hypothetical protein
MSDRKEMHAFMQDDKTAKVFLTNEGWEVDYYNKGYLILTEPFHDKSETYAENSADNYVMGIKQIQLNG